MSDLDDDPDDALDSPEVFEPEEGDYTTADHRHFSQFGRLAVVVDEDDEWAHALKDHMDRERFWPNVWFISDHSNVHLIDMDHELADADEKEGTR